MKQYSVESDAYEAFIGLPFAILW